MGVLCLCLSGSVGSPPAPRLWHFSPTLSLQLGPLSQPATESQGPLLGARAVLFSIFISKRSKLGLPASDCPGGSYQTEPQCPQPAQTWGPACPGGVTVLHLKAIPTGLQSPVGPSLPRSAHVSVEQRRGGGGCPQPSHHTLRDRCPIVKKTKRKKSQKVCIKTYFCTT